jgi:chromosome segregation ATPase
MSNENYVNYYVEILTSTLTDAIVRNVSLQANAKVTNEVIETQSKQLDNLNGIIDNLNDELEIIKHNNSVDNDNRIENLQSELKQKNEHIDNLNRQVNELNSMRSEYDNVKHQISHLDTFRNELSKERDLHQNTRNDYESKLKNLQESHSEKIKELTDKIDYLQLTPAKRKKIDEIKNTVVIENLEIVTPGNNTIIKDGGSF